MAADAQVPCNQWDVAHVHPAECDGTPQVVALAPIPAQVFQRGLCGRRVQHGE